MNALRGILLVLVTLATTGCKHGRVSSAGPVAAASTDGAPSYPASVSVPDTSPPSSTPAKANAMTQANTPAYVTPWVDGTRASRVSVSRRPLASLSAAARLDTLVGPLAARPLGDVQHVLAAPDGVHIVARGADAAWIFDTKGKHVGAVTIAAATGFTFVTHTGLFHQSSEYDWAGNRGAREVWLVQSHPGRAWATHVDDSVVSVVNQEPLTGNHDTRTPEQTAVVVGHFVTGSVTTAKVIGTDVIERAYGLGAIAKTGEICVMTTAHELRVYAPQGDEQFDLKRLQASRVAFAPYEMSIVNGAVAALESLDVPPVDEAEWRGSYQEGSDLFLRFSALGKHWKTRVHLVSLQGAELAQATVPFEVLEPPVDGGNGRMYLAGMGLAALDRGKVVWSQPGPRTLVTAFADGELAAAVGRELRIVDRDGHVRQSFATEGEPIETPPAIAPDGAVWFATNKALYVAR